MKRIFQIVLLVFCTTNCATYHRVRSNNILVRASIEASDFYEEIDYEVVSNLQLFDVTIEGNVYRFMFDTGGYTVFSEELVNSLKDVRKMSYIDVKDGNSVTKRIQTYTVNKLEIGDISFADVGFAKIGFTESEWFKCLGIDGTLGPNIMKECLWLFDNEAKKLVFTDNRTRLPILSKGIKVEIKTDNVYKPSIDFSIGSFNSTLGFDSGFNGFLGLQNVSGISSFDTLLSVTKVGNRSNAGNSVTFSDSKLIKVNNVDVNGLVLNNVVAESRQNASSNLLGSKIFERYKVLFDLSENAMYFEAIANFRDQDHAIYSYGFSFDYKDRKVVIGYVYEPSTAFTKGIKAGDAIGKVNGKEYNFSSYCGFIEGFRVPNSEYIELELIRNNKPILIRLKKEKIL
ncbi:aspartyl protease family protein [Flammeovirgaceae bacterium SG7u.111]|nr:aspartyl protease family protein [Flammeovirgaceae bacterium SG7u.132]WPO33618.1 aspartyl protease family protein [Flammeovirgaceae bacterium SG7u.111]